MSPEPDYAALDPGIRELVALDPGIRELVRELRAAGFDTTDLTGWGIEASYSSTDGVALLVLTEA